MKFKSPLLAVADLAASVNFYRRVLGLRVVQDFGANVTLTGGVSLQTLDTWRDFLDGGSVSPGGNDGELYFEEDDFDAFAARLRDFPIEYVHPVREHRWGQRVVRFYDPDHHILEVGENMRAVCRRFLAAGMTEEQAAARMDVPLKFVKACRGNAKAAAPGGSR